MTSDDLPRSWTRRNWMAMAGLIATGATGAAFGQNTPAPARKAAGGNPPPVGPAPIDVAVVLGAYNTLIDFAGPWEVLSSDPASSTSIPWLPATSPSCVTTPAVSARAGRSVA